MTVARDDESFAALKLEVGGKAPDVPVDPDRIRQLLWNLFKNAAKASPSGGKIRFDVDSDETHASLSVSDEGEGIDDVTNLFDMFYSGHDHGIGLGLAVVKQIVDSHQGEIHVEQSESGGAKFVVLLPMRSSIRPEAL